MVMDSAEIEMTDWLERATFPTKSIWLSDTSVIDLYVTGSYLVSHIHDKKWYWVSLPEEVVGLIPSTLFDNLDPAEKGRI